MMSDIDGTTDPGPAPSSLPQQQPPQQARLPAGLPPWVYALVGIVPLLSGGLAGYGGGTQATQDIAVLEEKLDQLTVLVTDLRIAIAAHHARKHP